MGPGNIAQILARLKTKMGGSLPSDFITWLEIILGGEKDLLACQYKYVSRPPNLLKLFDWFTYAHYDVNSNYNWYQYFNDQMTASGLTSTEIGYVKIWSSDYPKVGVKAEKSWVIANNPSYYRNTRFAGRGSCLPPDSSSKMTTTISRTMALARATWEAQYV